MWCFRSHKFTRFLNTRYRVLTLLQARTTALDTKEILVYKCYNRLRSYNWCFSVYVLTSRFNFDLTSYVVSQQNPHDGVQAQFFWFISMDAFTLLYCFDQAQKLHFCHTDIPTYYDKINIDFAVQFLLKMSVLSTTAFLKHRLHPPLSSK